MKTRFDAFWLSGSWRKLGKESARTRFLASVKTEQDWIDIQAARDAYNAYCMVNRRWYSPVHGAVWFGTRKGWRDWIPDEERTEALVDDMFDEAEIRLMIEKEKERMKAQWDIEVSKHTHDARCQFGAVCAWVEAKRPK